MGPVALERFLCRRKIYVNKLALNFIPTKPKVNTFGFVVFAFKKLAFLMNIRVITCILLGFSCQMASGLEFSADSLQAEEAYLLASGFYESGQFDSATYYYEQSADYYRKLDNIEKHFDARLKIASVLRRTNKIDSAIQYSELLLKEVQAYEAHGLMESHVLEVLGNCHNINSDFLTALDIQQSILEIRENFEVSHPELLINAYSNLAITYFRLGYYEDALETFENVLEQRQQFYDNKDHKLIADAYHNMALAYFLISNERNKSLAYYEKALAICKRIYPEGHPEFSSVYNGLSQVLITLNRPEEALTYGKLALEIGLQSFQEYHYLVTDALSNMSDVHLLEERFQEALKVNERTLRINLAQFGENHIFTADSYRQLAATYDGLNDRKSAQKNLFHSLAIYERLFPGPNPAKANSYLSIAQHYEAELQLDSALHYLNKSFLSNRVDSDSLNASNNILSNTIDKILWLRTLLLKSQIQHRIGERDGNSEVLETALKGYQQSDVLLYQMRLIPMLQEDFLHWSEVASHLYQDAIEVCESLSNLTGEERKYGALGFAFSRKSKSSLLKLHMLGQKAKHFAGIPDSLLQNEKKLKVDRNYWQTRDLNLHLESEQDSNQIYMVREKLFNLRREEDQLLAELQNNYPEYYRIKYDSSQLSIHEIQQKLGPTETLVEFFTAGEQIKAFTLTQSAFQVTTLGKSESLVEDITTLHQSLAENDFDNYSRLGYKLYTLLIEPLQVKTHELLIIPDGPLHFMNFDVLLTSVPDKLNFKNCHYLIRDHSIRYHYSSDLWSENHSFKANPKVLAFSFGDAENGGSGVFSEFRNRDLLDIPGASAEIAAISRLLEGEYHFGSNASESQFKKRARDFQIIHLALHGVVDHENPMRSRISFYPKADSLEDNQLYTFELINVELAADLVVVSACDAGVGQVRKGDGVVNLAKSFSYAGSKSLIFSLWELSDKVAPQIIVPFYENLLRGTSKSNSLRQAKLDYLSTADNISANPYYWAPLVFYGSDGSIKQDWGGKKWIIVSIVLLMLIMGSVLALKRLRNS